MTSFAEQLAKDATIEQMAESLNHIAEELDRREAPNMAAYIREAIDRLKSRA